MFREALEHLLREYGYGVVGVVIFFESLGMPLPGESLLIGAALYAATTHKVSIEWVVAAATVGAVLGDNAGYLIGHSLGYRLLRRVGPRVGLTEKRLRLGEYLFRQHGGKVVFFGRFVAILRTFAALLAGANHMAWHSFLIFNTLGGVVWCCLYGFGAYGLGDVVRQIAGPVSLALAVVGGIAVIGVFVFIKHNEKRLEAMVEALAGRGAPPTG
jgi:membrane protein DedA with SNARE-associated domain